MSYMVTASGRKVYPRDLDRSEFVISDIAIQLSRECRFNGACKDFYSVAQHCINVAMLIQEWGLRPQVQLWALLHDAHEAYVRDVVSPFKSMVRDYQDLCALVQLHINAHFLSGIPINNSESVAIRDADLVMLATEKRDLMPFDPEPWPVLENVEPMETKVHAYGHTWAAVRFLELYWQLADHEGERDLAIIMREAGL